eukprot:jgi/Botrbrau1/8874/Bobra.50_2s0030.1
MYSGILNPLTIVLICGCAAARSSPSADLSEGQTIIAAPAFCRGIECPPFKSKTTKAGYEIRTYRPGKWVTCTVHTGRVELAIAAGFARIGLYLEGRNSEKQHISQTVPVSAYYNKKGDYEAGRNYTIGLYIPQEVQDNPPLPTDDSLTIENLPEETWYVASFPGYATEGLVLQHAQALRDVLVKDGATFLDGEWAFNVYDPPTKFTGRHNEVAFIAKGPVRAVEQA